MTSVQAVFSLVVAAVVWFSLKVVGIGYGSAEFEFDQAYQQRRPLNDQDMYDLYMADSSVEPEVVFRVRRIFGRQFSLDHKRILPDDDFVRIYEELDLEFVFEDVEDAFDVDLDDVSPIKGRVRTFAEIVQYKLLDRFGRIVLPPEDVFAAAMQSRHAYN
jgi:hypothetical protein